jgi:hypothetical protein
MDEVASRHTSRAVLVIRVAQALSLVCLLSFLVSGAGSPAGFFTLLALVMATGAATGVLATRHSPWLLSLAAAAVGAAVGFAVTWVLGYVGVVFFFGDR